MVRKRMGRRAHMNAGALKIAGAAAGLFAVVIAALYPGDATARRDEARAVLSALLDMDHDDIADMRMDIADAIDRIEIHIADIEMAAERETDRRRFKDFKRLRRNAYGAIEGATGLEIRDLRRWLDDAEALLMNNGDRVSRGEYRETRYAIDVIRTGLDDIEHALRDLQDAEPLT